MAVRAKLRLHDITPHEGGAKTVRFHAEYDPSIPEDQRFSEATPSGSVELYVNNQAALAQFEQGKAYYLDFTPVPEASAGTEATKAASEAAV